jgi:hypothetical protein
MRHEERMQMVIALTDNEVRWLAGGNANYDEVEASIRFFAGGGFLTYTDKKLQELYTNLTA